MPRLTIVIPALGEVDSLEATLLSVLENRPDDCEILVPHCGDYDDPYQLGEEVVFVEQPAAACGVDLINAGCEAAEGEIVHLLAAGVRVTSGWTASALRQFDDRLLGSVSPLLLDASGERVAALAVAYSAAGCRRVVGAGRKHRPRRPSAVKAIGPTWLAGFYRRAALEEAGRWARDVGDELADVDLALALAALGWTTCHEPDCQLHLDAPPPPAEPGFRRAWLAERLFWRHAATVGWVKSLLLHPWAVGWEATTSLPRGAALTQPLARLLATIELPKHLRYQRGLRQAIASVAERSGDEAARADEAADVLPFPKRHRRDNGRTPNSLRNAS